MLVGADKRRDTFKTDSGFSSASRKEDQTRRDIPILLYDFRNIVLYLVDFLFPQFLRHTEMEIEGRKWMEEEIVISAKLSAHSPRYDIISWP
jgi:hypothetical protein